MNNTYVPFDHVPSLPPGWEHAGTYQFDPLAILAETNMIKALRMFDAIPAEERDRILLALCTYYGHAVQG